MKGSARTLQWGFLAFAVLFVCLLPFYPYPAGWIVKALPAASLAVLAAWHISGRTGTLLSLGFLFSAAGDAVLAWYDLYAGPYFTIGLALFLLAHLFYIAAFARGFRLCRSRLSMVEVMVALVTILALLLRPRLGDMALPVLVYIVVITVMAVLAVLREMEGSFLVLGGLAFLLSDSLIAVNRFLMPLPAAPYLTMITYYFAQLMIAQAFLRQEQTRRMDV